VAQSPLQFFFRLLWEHFRWRTLGLALLAGSGIGLMGFEPVLMKQLVDGLRLGEMPQEQSWAIFWLIVVIWFASAGCNRLREWLDLHTAPDLRMKAQEMVYEWLDQHSPRYFQDHMAGSLSQKVKQAGSSTLILLDVVFNGFVRLVVAILMSALILSSAPGYFFWGFLGWLTAFFLASAWFAKRCVPLFEAFGEQVSSSTGILVDINSHMELVRSHAKAKAERLRVRRALIDERAASRRTRRFLIIMMLVLYSALLAFQSAFIGFALNAHLLGEMSLGDVIMIVTLGALLVNNIWNLFEQLLQFFEQVGTLGSALRMIAKPHEILEVPNAPALIVQRGEIRFERVTYRFQNGEALFQDLDLTIEAGERVGLVGASGAGKSTLTKLIRRHYDLIGGRILIDGQDVARVTLDSLNAAIADVPQDPALFHRTLRENIVYAQPEVSEDRVLAAVRAARCEEFISKRPEGLDVLVGERGVRLSGGERQRVALARAFIKDAPILILDEATSALDSETEHLIQEALLALCAGRTVVAIAHRLSTLTQMDRILVMDQGRMVESGTHQSLLAQSGAYARLWARQTMLH